MNKERVSLRPGTGSRRFRIQYEVRHGEYCDITESEDIGAPDAEGALRKFFAEHLDFGSGVFAESIEQVEVTHTSGRIREAVSLPHDDTGEQNDRVLDLVATAALSARFIRPPGGPAPVIRWWEGGNEFLMSFEQIEDITYRQPCPTCKGFGEVEVNQRHAPDLPNDEPATN